MASLKRRKVASGVRYDVRWWADGAQRSKTFRLRGPAEAWKRKVESDELVGLISDARAGTVPLETYAHEWLATRLVKGKSLAPMTLTSYRGLLRRNIRPALGKVQLRKLTPEAIRVSSTQPNGMHRRAGVRVPQAPVAVKQLDVPLS